ncbi:endonuclease-reverse transcriptase [Plakobranchus ocellatus]|uniref:Endonuclease-reverse transcriptase n=1 Tax=Plakobranchus ocellatus TaxID=259542 RepID=A0AAV3YSZ7_9GAST|nr:endonuclease-reverse transcriptase [Plakobranchus ocellatus]
MDTNKQLCHKVQTAQVAMERKMLNIRLKVRIPTIAIRKKIQVIDVAQYIQRQKWRWAGYIAREKDNRWTKKCTEGNQGQEEETGAGQKQDGWMASEEQQVHNGRGRYKIGGIGRYLQRGG